MANLLIITQKVDEYDDLLGSFVGWIREFAKNFDRVFVIALGSGKYELPANVEVRSLGKEKHTNAPIRILKLKMLFKFYWYLFKLVPKSDGIFVHMSPIFAVAAAPVAKFYRKKIVLWYLHRSVTFRLRFAALLSHKIVTASAESLGIKIPAKILSVGHGIDISRFNLEKPQLFHGGQGTLRILSVGRISPIKNYETLINAAEILKNRGLHSKTEIVGQPVMPGDHKYFEFLKNQVVSRNLEDSIKFTGLVPYSQIAGYYKDADLVVNLTPRGGIDKTVLEAMASGALVLVSNRVFDKILGPYADDLIFRENDAEDLAAKLKKLNDLSSPERFKISDYLKSEVLQNHNLVRTIKLISQLF